jgi:alkanesulfonate monooxygenase SsuD/methylene tetrahydromethanopterin reductase-like flavin-dependent oxidoreductase (luciferase family)
VLEQTGEMLTAVGAVTVPGAEPPPVLLAALGAGMLRLAGEAAHGTITWMAGPRTLGNHVVPLITAAAHCAGRPTPQVVAGLSVCVTVDEADVRQRIARHFAMAAQVPEYQAVLNREGVNGPADVAIVGDENAVAHHLKLIAETGVSEFIAAPFGNADEAAPFGNADEQARTTNYLHHLG